jgi:hypothetical protein
MVVSSEYNGQPDLWDRSQCLAQKTSEKIRNLIVELTRGNIPFFKASWVADEIGDLERNLEKHVSHLRK